MIQCVMSYIDSNCQTYETTAAACMFVLHASINFHTYVVQNWRSQSLGYIISDNLLILLLKRLQLKRSHVITALRSWSVGSVFLSPRDYWWTVEMDWFLAGLQSMTALREKINIADDLLCSPLIWSVCVHVCFSHITNLIIVVALLKFLYQCSLSVHVQQSVTLRMRWCV